MGKKHILNSKVVLVLSVALITGYPLLSTGKDKAPAPPAKRQTSVNLLNCKLVPRLLQGYLSQHVSKNVIDNKIKELTAKNYLKRLDGSKMLLLEPEVKEIEKKIVSIFDKSENGDCSALVEIQKMMIARSKEAEAFVKSFVGNKKYKLDEKAELVTDVEKRGYSKTKEEWHELLKKYAHFQISNYEIAGTKLNKAKERLIHRHELITKRNEESEMGDHLSGFLDSFASALDPHSSYFSPEALEDFKISMGLSLEGIGATLSTQDGYTVVGEVIKGGAADRHGILKPKDKIVAVAQSGEEPVQIIDMDLRDVVRLIRGRKGTKVTLTVLRESEKTTTFTTTIIRDKIDLKDQAAKFRVEKIKSDSREMKLGVIDLPSFYGRQGPGSRSSYRDVKNLLKRVQKEKVDGLLLDLSSNGGGLLQDAVRITGLFMKKGGVVATRVAQNPPEVLEDEDEEIFFNGPIVVLTSRLSASASEILAGAMKDYRRAIIVGDKSTFGKGSVQTVMSLPPGLGALKITSGLFFRPGGFSTQLKGVASDVEIPSEFASTDIGEKSFDNPLDPQKIDSFVSADANFEKEDKKWTPVPTEIIGTLQKLSGERVEKSKEFKDLKERLEKAKNQDGIVKLAEIRKHWKEEEKKTSKESKNASPKKDDDYNTPQYQEALHVLADYVRILKTPVVAAKQGS